MALAGVISNPLREGLSADRVPVPCSLVIYGASGDLTARKLVPALYNLYKKHLLPASFSLIGISRSKISDDEFKQKLKEMLKKAEPELTDALWDSFSQNFHYLAGGYDEPVAYRNLSNLLDQMDKDNGTSGNRVFYLSTPPNVFEPIISNLGAAGLNKEGKGYSRVVIEKPFGHDLDSAKELNRKVQEVFKEHQIYRIDHYLGKETVQNLLVMRFANSIFEPIWNRENVDHVQITAAEELGVGSRAGYYESSGVLRDMFQNHLFQVMCMVAMEPPVAFDANAIRDEKLKILQSIRPFHPESIAQFAVRGQYGPGYLAGQKVPGYREEKEVNPQSITPTYAALKVFLDTWRWHGVPFFLRSAKRLPKRSTEVAIQFKEPPNLLFKKNIGGLSPNLLVIRIQPDEGMTLRFETKVPGMTTEARTVNMDFRYGTSFAEDAPEAYERLLLDCMLGDATLFIRGDEAEAAWQALMPVLTHWETTQPEQSFPNYEAGTWGPVEADKLLEKPWRKWRRL
ncbi:MAG TPA: glucose-6-phosphate dehydrogenase [bacterium]|nr:glucose-6-phosphate dehydrogenase [bacterium]